MVRRQTKTPAEADCFEGKHLYCYLHNAHGIAVKKIKRAANRRERREGKKATQEL